MNVLATWFQINQWRVIQLIVENAYSRDEITYDNSNNNDDIISHDNTVSHDDICSKGTFHFLSREKCVKELQNFRVAFLNKLSNIEQNLKRNLKKKEHDEKYERHPN